MARSGEDLTFRVVVPDNANEYAVQVWQDPDGNWDGIIYQKDGITAEDGWDVNIPARKLPDHSTTIHVGVTGRGYGISEAGNIWDIRVIDAEDGIQFWLEENRILTGEQITAYVVNAPEDIHVMIERPTGEEGGAEPEPIEADDAGNYHYYNTWETGTYALWVETSADGETWTTVGNDVEVNVITNGELDEPTVTGDRKYFAGDSIVLNIGTVENAEAYIAMVYDRTENEELFDEPKPVEAGKAAEILKNLESGKIYDVSIGAFGTGYIPSWTTVSVACVDPNKVFQMILPANLQTIEDEAFSGVEMQTVIVSGNNTTFNLDILSEYGTILVVAPDDANISEDAGFVRITPEEYSK